MNRLQKKFSIRTKVIFVVLVNILILGGFVFGISELIIARSYLDIEKKFIIENIERVQDAIKNTTSELSLKLIDWAFWDDTYEFMEKQDAEYIKSNLNNLSIVNLKVDAMVYVDTDNQIVLKKMVDQDTFGEVSADNIAKYVSSHPELTTYSDSESGVAGIIQLPEGLFIVSSLPILTSAGQGPARGSLIFGKMLSDTVIESLEKLTHLSFQVYDYQSKSLPVDVLDAKSKINEKDIYFIHPNSNQSIFGYKVIYDIFNEPVLIIKVESSRQVYNQGQFTIYFFIALVGLFILIFGIGILVFLEKIVISKLVVLGAEVENIDPKDSKLLRVKERSNDEIGKLAGKINHMLDVVDSSRKVEKEALETMRLVDMELNNRLEEIEKTNKLMIDRELKMIELKKEIEILKIRK